MSEDGRLDAAHDNEIQSTDTVTTEATIDALGGNLAADNTESTSGSDTFPRPYVEELRKESAQYLERSQAAEERADKFARRLHRQLVTATGRLENPDDLPFNADHLDDDKKLTAALDVLLAERPYLKARKVTGDAGQGARGGGPEPFSLLAAMRGRR